MVPTDCIYSTDSQRPLTPNQQTPQSHLFDRHYHLRSSSHKPHPVLATGSQFPLDQQPHPPPPPFDGWSTFNPVQRFATSDCGRPQMAHEIYERLLAVAKRQAKPTMSFTPLEVRLAAFTGHRLVYREAATNSRPSAVAVATSLEVDYHRMQ